MYPVKRKRAKGNPSAASRQVLLRQRFCPSKKKWSKWSTIYYRPPKSTKEPLVYQFSGGGQLRIHPNILPSNRQKAVTKELMQCSNFRQYSIQGNPEPRTHFLLHENATNNFDVEAQPGYHYGNIKMKAKPLETLPHVHKLSRDMQNMYLAVDGDCFWNIGVNPVLYRDGRDKMGYHADDDQGEKIILTVPVSSPIKATRCIRIRPYHSKGKGIMEGDEEFELLLGSGDAYSMDGKQNLSLFATGKLQAKLILCLRGCR
jgi:alkylated DNA repair dioxygenase AlkB